MDLLTEILECYPNSDSPTQHNYFKKYLSKFSLITKVILELDNEKKHIAVTLTI